MAKQYDTVIGQKCINLWIHLVRMECTSLDLNLQWALSKKITPCIPTHWILTYKQQHNSCFHFSSNPLLRICFHGGFPVMEN